MLHGNVLVCQTGETVALKKVALRRLEDGIPNQALREIKALQEIEDNQHVSVRVQRCREFLQRTVIFYYSQTIKTDKQHKIY